MVGLLGTNIPTMVYVNMYNEFFPYLVCRYVRLLYTVKCSPLLFSLLSPSLSAGEFKAGQIQMSQMTSLLTQLCLGEFKTGRNCVQVFMGEKYPVRKKPCIQYCIFIYINVYSKLVILQGSVVDVVGASVVVMVVFTTGNGCCVAGIRNVDGAGVTGIAVTVQYIICSTSVPQNMHEDHLSLIIMTAILEFISKTNNSVKIVTINNLQLVV